MRRSAEGLLYLHSGVGKNTTRRLTRPAARPKLRKGASSAPLRVCFSYFAFNARAPAPAVFAVVKQSWASSFQVLDCRTLATVSLAGVLGLGAAKTACTPSGW